MRKFTCPACSNKTIPMSSKLLVGPSAVITCGGCGAGLSVPPLRAGFFLLPFMFGALYTNIMTSIPIGVGVLCMGFAITFSLWCRHLPFIIKDSGPADKNDMDGPGEQSQPMPESAA